MSLKYPANLHVQKRFRTGLVKICDVGPSPTQIREFVYGLVALGMIV